MDEQRILQLIKNALAEQSIQRATIDAKEAAAYVGVCIDTFMTDVRAGKVPHTKIRGRYVFRIAALDRWMDEQEQMNCRRPAGTDPAAAGFGGGVRGLTS